jgi:DNA-binding transcriptional MerR regulator
MSDTWTIGELAQRAADALRSRAPSLNGRVREVPGERLIRWYTTIGLIDPPLTRRGRVARYGRRHLLQLVAVKRLQANGLSIADIQAALAGATDALLERTAGLTGSPEAAAPAPAAPGPSPSAPAASVSPPSGPAERARTRFWARDGDRPRAAPAGETTAPAPSGAPVWGVRLGDGVTLLVEGARTASPEDIQAVLAAARPLLAVLEERKLT